jgi:hypothetical protein
MRRWLELTNEWATKYPWRYALFGGLLSFAAVALGAGIADGRWAADARQAAVIGAGLALFFRWQLPRAARRRNERLSSRDDAE